MLPHYLIEAKVNPISYGNYGGPISLAEDFMDRDITKAKITTRMAFLEEATSASPGTIPALSPKASDRDEYSRRLNWKLPYSKFIADGTWNADDVLGPIY